MGVASTNHYYRYVSCEGSTDEGESSKVKINVCLSIHSMFISSYDRETGQSSLYSQLVAGHVIAS